MSEPSERAETNGKEVPIEQISDAFLISNAISKEIVECSNNPSCESDKTTEDGADCPSTGTCFDGEDTNDEARDTSLFDRICDNHSEHHKFLHAVARGDSRQLQTFLDADVDVNGRDEDGLSAIMVAAAYRDRPMVKLLIDAKAQTNYDDPRLISLLTRFRDCKTIVDVFLDKLESQLESQLEVISWFPLTFLQWAASVNNIALMKLLLLAGANTNTRDARGLTALTMATEHGHVGPVQLLIRAGVTKEDMISALFMACEKGHAAVIELLLAAGVDVNTENEEDKKPIVIAAEHNYASAVKILLENGAHVSEDVLLHASSHGNADMLRALVNAGANVNVEYAFGETPLMRAVSSGNDEAVRVLINSGADIHHKNRHGHWSLSLAVEGGHMRIMQTLIAVGASVVPKKRFESDTPQSLLMTAVATGRAEIVKFLLDRGADKQVNVAYMHGFTPLMTAAHHRYIDVMELLIAAKADVNMVNDNSESALYMTTMGESRTVIQAMQVLLAAGADVNIATKFGTTPLLFTLEMGQIDVMKFLIDANADVNATSGNNHSPLITAVRRRNVKATELLLAAKASVEDCNHVGDRALHNAVHRGAIDITRMLIDAKADVNARGGDGWAPLMFSVSDELCMRALLDARADMYACDDDGCTVLMHAAAFGCPEVLHVLRDAVLSDDAQTSVSRD